LGAVTTSRQRHDEEVLEESRRCLSCRQLTIGRGQKVVYHFKPYLSGAPENHCQFAI
jgi:hypothetical protein